MVMLHVALLVFSLLVCCHGQTTMNIENTTYVEVTASGLKMMLSKQMNISEDKNALMVELKGLEEINGTTTGKTFNLTGVMFTIEGPTDASDVVMSKRIKVSGEDTVFRGNLTLTFDIFKEAGTITKGDEETNVTKGDVRVGAKLENYNFPDDIDSLKLSLMISGSEATPKQTNEPAYGGVSYDLGGGGVVGMSKMAKQGGEDVVVMPMMADKMMTVSFNRTVSQADIEYSIALRPATVSISDNKPSSSTRIAYFGLYLWFLLFAQTILW